jgi:hypothetical protein
MRLHQYNGFRVVNLFCCANAQSPDKAMERMGLEGEKFFHAGERVCRGG